MTSLMLEKMRLITFSPFPQFICVFFFISPPPLTFIPVFISPFQVILLCILINRVDYFIVHAAKAEECFLEKKDNFSDVDPDISAFTRVHRSRSRGTNEGKRRA